MALYDPNQFPDQTLAVLAKPKYTEAEKRLQNLQRLADYLWLLPENYSHFNMASYFLRYGRGSLNVKDLKKFIAEAKKPNVCGTVACAAGHGIAAGIRMIKADDTEWDKYVERAFTQGNGELYAWLFGGSWEEWDNTPIGAAQRIYYFLQKKTSPPMGVFSPHDVSEVTKFYQNQQPVTWEGVPQNASQ
jgi:hypothetical protein